MKLLEIINLRSYDRIHREFVDELLNSVDESDVASSAPKHLIRIRLYHHAVVENDLSIHICWESDTDSQNKSNLGLRFSYALKSLGLLNHSVWVERSGQNGLPKVMGEPNPESNPELAEIWISRTYRSDNNKRSRGK